MNTQIFGNLFDVHLAVFILTTQNPGKTPKPIK